MEATELIELIRTSEKKTPVRVVLQANAPCEFPGAEVFSGGNGLHILYGDWKTLGPQLTAQAAHIDRLHVENGACNSAIPMLDLKGLPCARRAGRHHPRGRGDRRERRRYDGRDPESWCRRRRGQHDRHGRCARRPCHRG